MLFHLRLKKNSCPWQHRYCSDGTGSNGFTAADGEDYGCAGRSYYSAFTRNAGKVIKLDPVDVAFKAWKECIKCAGYKNGNIPKYDYDQASNSCGM